MAITQMHTQIKKSKESSNGKSKNKRNIDRDNKLSILLLTSKLFDFNNSLSLASERSMCSPCFNCSSSLDLNPI
jgi:hypothetical protein